jgi:hypothetical protein
MSEQPVLHVDEDGNEYEPLPFEDGHEEDKDEDNA